MPTSSATLVNLGLIAATRLGVVGPLSPSPVRLKP